MTFLVTGATGLVGNNVVRRLLERGQAVRVLVRRESDFRPLQGLEVERVWGDVRDADSVRQACRGVSAVVHAAAVVRFGWTGLEQDRAVNVRGTEHVAAAALEASARLVHVSSVDALGVGHRDAPADEDSLREGKVPCTYIVTKREAEAAVRRSVDRGLDAVIVNPGFMLGPWDWKPSSGRMLLEVARRFTPLAPTGGVTSCDVRDVVDGLLAACEKAPAGRQYILGGENLTYQQLWCLFAEVSGGSKPWFRAGPLMRVLGGYGGDLWGRITGREPDLNSAAVRATSQFHYYRSARAEAELGYRPRPFRQSVADAWAWFVEHGYVDDKKK
ncbi:MAG: NAD-dependent epimerase/dehydratase family protein [Candidatus Anammoximicrobium sp.]|nr:NAD-dependent epimerase/dehydratase family protein [Candidatus Anammoximicrobium sp.]